MKEVIVNRLKIKCSKGRIEKGETVILSDAEIAKICALRPDSVTVSPFSMRPLLHLIFRRFTMTSFMDVS